MCGALVQSALKSVRQHSLSPTGPLAVSASSWRECLVSAGTAEETQLVSSSVLLLELRLYLELELEPRGPALLSLL